MLHGSHFRNRPPWLMLVQFHMPQYLKMFMEYQSICVPILVLLSQSERLVQVCLTMPLHYSDILSALYENQLENGFLSNGQQPQSVVNGFY